MKRTTSIFALILLLEIGVYAQKYFPFPTENVNWNVYLEYSISENPTDTLLLRYTLHGDTIINQVVYKNLCLESGDTLNPKIESIGGLRETDQKVYFIGQDFLSFPHDEELLLYDFNKQIASVEYIDVGLGGLLSLLAKEKRKTLVVVCSDHGECFGEDGLYGHGFYHPKVMEVLLGIFEI